MLQEVSLTIIWEHKEHNNGSNRTIGEVLCGVTPTDQFVKDVVVVDEYTDGSNDGQCEDAMMEQLVGRECPMRFFSNDWILFNK